MDAVAQRILDDAKLPDQRGATANELRIGRYELPLSAEHVLIDERLSRYLFREHANWGLVVAFNSNHIHHTKTNRTVKGVWYVFECNPHHIPRVWYPVAPFLFGKMGTSIYFDRKDGELIYPINISGEQLLRALEYKNIYNTAVRDELADTIRDLNTHNEGLKDFNSARADVFGDDFVKSIEEDNKIKSTDTRPSKQPLLVDPSGNPVSSND